MGTSTESKEKKGAIRPLLRSDVEIRGENSSCTLCLQKITEKNPSIDKALFREIIRDMLLGIPNGADIAVCNSCFEIVAPEAEKKLGELQLEALLDIACYGTEAEKLALVAKGAETLSLSLDKRGSVARVLGIYGNETVRMKLIEVLGRD